MIDFVGPSYSLANRKVSIQRAVNLYLSKLEATEKRSEEHTSELQSR